MQGIGGGGASPLDSHQGELPWRGSKNTDDNFVFEIFDLLEMLKIAQNRPNPKGVPFRFILAEIIIYFLFNFIFWSLKSPRSLKSPPRYFNSTSAIEPLILRLASERLTLWEPRLY